MYYYNINNNNKNSRSSSSVSTNFRLHSRSGGDRPGRQVGGDCRRYRLAAASYLLPGGMPFVYYGEEARCHEIQSLIAIVITTTNTIDNNTMVMIDRPVNREPAPSSAPRKA